ncbi:hypothetical protein PM082_022252 [Marasmius tenuissimus]|nr:hypothetical protein PM082_022252 [Marasmius tenuissimus]
MSRPKPCRNDNHVCGDYTPRSDNLCHCGCTESMHGVILPPKGGIPGICPGYRYNGEPSIDTPCLRCTRQWLGHENATVPPPQTAALSTSFYRSSTQASLPWTAPSSSLSTTNNHNSQPAASSSSSSISATPRSAFSAAYVSTTSVPTRSNVSIPRGSSRNAFSVTQTANQVKEKREKKGKKLEHPVEGPQYSVTNRTFKQTIAIVLFPYLVGVTKFPLFDSTSAKERPRAKFTKAAFRNQLHLADELHHLVELEVEVANTATDNLYPAIYDTVVEHCTNYNFVFDGIELPTEPPTNPPFVVCGAGRVTEGMMTIGATDYGKTWTLDNLNRAFAENKMRIAFGQNLVVLLGLMYGRIDPSSADLHPCYSYRFVDAFMNTEFSQKPRPSIECMSECPGFQQDAEEVEEEEEDDDEPIEEPIGRRRGRQSRVTVRRVRQRVASPSPSFDLRASRASSPGFALASQHTSSPVPSLLNSNPEFPSFRPLSTGNTWSRPASQRLSSPSSTSSSALPISLSDSSSITNRRLPSPSTDIVRRRSPSLEIIAIRPRNRSMSTELGIQPSSISPLHDWLSDIEGCEQPDLDRPALHISAGSIQEAANALLVCLFKHHKGQPIPSTVGSVLIHKFDYSHLLCGWKVVVVNSGNGTGVIQNVLRTCITMFTSRDDLFTPTRDDLVTWAFPLGSSSDPDRLAWASVLGSLSALHIVWMEVSPSPIDPMLLGIFTQDFDTMKDLAIIREFHPDLAEELLLWPSFDDKGAAFLDDERRRKLHGIVSQYFTYTLPQIRGTSSLDSWNSLTDALYAKALYAAPVGFEDSEELLAAREGFDMQLGTKRLSELFTDDNAVPVLSALTTQTLSTAQQVIDLVAYPDGQFHISDPLFVPAFKRRLEGYLRGYGHPKCLVGPGKLIPAEQATREDDPLFRPLTKMFIVHTRTGRPESEIRKLEYEIPRRVGRLEVISKT